MTAGRRGAVAAIEDSIRAYVQAHPGAADSAVGIHSWWLPARLANRSLTDVQQALAALVAAGELVETPMPDRGTIYSGAQGSSKAP
jgi:hypothetical protein